MSLKPLVLYGAGGMGREVVPIVNAINAREPTYDLLGFVVGSAYYSEGQVVSGLPVLGDDSWLVERAGEVFCSCTLGNPRARSEVQRSLSSQGVEFESLVDPSVWIPPTVTIGAGAVVYCDVRISDSCVLGEGVFLNCGVTVGHDAVLGDYTCVMPGTGISGGCVVGKEVLVGGHAFIVPKKRVGDGAVVAAGSIVFGNVRAGATVLGNPAKRVKGLEV